MYGEALLRVPTHNPFVYHLTKKVPLLYTFHWQRCPVLMVTLLPFLNSQNEVNVNQKQVQCIFFVLFMFCGNGDTQIWDLSTLKKKDLNLWIPFPSIHMKPEKGTPFGQSLPVEDINYRECHSPHPPWAALELLLRIYWFVIKPLGGCYLFSVLVG